MNKQVKDKHAEQQHHTTQPPYTEAEKNRLMQHLIQIENQFNNRLNTFLVLETILFGTVSILYSNKVVDNFMLLVINCLGLVLTLIWGYAQARQRYVYKSIKTRCIEHLQEYEDTQDERAKQHWPVSTTVILTFITPSLMVLVWVVLLVHLLVKL